MFNRALSICRESENGHPCFPDVQLRVGKCLLYGTGVDRDIEDAHALLSFALLNLYKKRQTDPSVKRQIAQTKKMIAEAQKYLDAI